MTIIYSEVFSFDLWLSRCTVICSQQHDNKPCLTMTQFPGPKTRSLACLICSTRQRHQNPESGGVHTAFWYYEQPRNDVIFAMAPKPQLVLCCCCPCQLTEIAWHVICGAEQGSECELVPKDAWACNFAMVRESRNDFASQQPQAGLSIIVRCETAAYKNVPWCGRQWFYRLYLRACLENESLMLSCWYRT